MPKKSMLFNTVKINAPRRNKFDLSHEHKLSMFQGNLVPTLVQEVLPGDSFRVNSEIFMRVAPLLAPIMHRVDVRLEYFFVPNRLIWDEWEDFITGGEDGESAPVVPFVRTSSGEVTGGYFAKSTLWDYMGLPVIDPSATVTSTIDVSVLPFRAYQQIYNDYYRDQNLQPANEFSKASGQMSGASELNKLLSLWNRCWEKDYLTSCLPFAQRGPEVLTPVSVRVDQARLSATGTPPIAGASPISYDASGQLMNDTPVDIYLEGDNAASSINDLRRAYALQRWYEKAARVGSRYVEQIKGFFGVTSSDARLQRAEYLGGGKAPIQISEVLSSVQLFDAADPSDPIGYPQGNMSGRGVAGVGAGFKRTFEEHGYVIGIVSVIPRTAYQQNINREWRRFDRFDYGWPEFANIGEQAVLKPEAYWFPTEASSYKDEVFGYQSRYAEYKYKESRVSGEFRDTLAFWHMGRIFNSTPELNAAFVESNPTDRIYAVQDGSTLDQLYSQIYHKVDVLRALPVYGTPI